MRDSLLPLRLHRQLQQKTKMHICDKLFLNLCTLRTNIDIPYVTGIFELSQLLKQPSLELDTYKINLRKRNKREEENVKEKSGRGQKEKISYEE